MDLIKSKTYIYRAIRTFIQTFLANVVVAVPMIDWSKPNTMLKAALFSLVASSVAAGVSAVMNMKEEVV